MAELPNEARATELRNTVVDQLKDGGWITSPSVEAALRKVPRHLAVPDVPLDDAYSTYNAVVTQQDAEGVHTSSVSAPQIQAMQLEQARIRPGDRVLEIGTNGPNAAYLAELTGPTGEVTTMDIDLAPAARARRFLAEAGYTNVRVVVDDGEYGLPAHAPYDAIVVTVGAWDIPPAWTDQLKEGGRLVVPLRINGLTRTYAFARQGGVLTAESAHVCGFVAMRGDGARNAQEFALPDDPGVTLRFDDGVPVDPQLLVDTLNTERVEIWTGVSVASNEPIGTLQMYVATMLPGYCNMFIDQDETTGKVGPTGLNFSLVAVDGPNLAYVVVRRSEDRKSAEFGVHAFGPDAENSAHRLADAIRTWGKDHRSGPGPRITVYPAGTADEQISGDRVIDKKHRRISISWPPAK
ncbi:methyltransferase, FxLD system [Streptomyces sp. ISL-12]|uniref:methyltransferase, FxLD system n=1 Tax=Streptomyces sp. ISL-12 TaxID=2819177 RepID=UPI001BE676DC|nr:methyltransferase, FxLD system [Streptomyces sp. ISL-12]MBT2412072.1 methyltransferase, FxLD system [Streptomyces sp. ISL-12]